MNKTIKNICLLAFLIVAISCQDFKLRKKIIILKYKSNATFDCKELKDPEFYQLKEGTESEKKYEGNEKNVKIEEGELTLYDIRGEEINADYLCRNKVDHSKKIEFIKQIAPYLYKPEKSSQTVSEGNKADFKCTLLFGQQKPEKTKWEWRFKNDSNPLVEIDGKIKIISNENETMLSILNVVDSDKGEYECVVITQHGTHSEKVQLRVKDALAALWPFLAIVAEVLILCVILLVCEKKCSKKRNPAEEDNEQTQNLMGRDGNSELKKRAVKA